ncbi:hypothetical protein SAMN05443252_102637 [Bacillus sp. OV322]|uniref:hypothetical protein n=1 Tax=Bacillus sp. OV322 TaxID=1882764 RepID=UPI0008E544B2|nr:hypothetical protein [Bacillus sp. OV322]SFC30259.1 hypothetical protein SAMN05443252_102637 [Bacillus sp. OV322]
MKYKSSVLAGLTGMLAILLFVFFQDSSNMEKVRINEKYYPEYANGKAVGFKTKKVINVSKTAEGNSCAMEFSNGKTLEIDCGRYLDYRVGDTVYIDYKGNHVTDIQRKK